MKPLSPWALLIAPILDEEDARARCQAQLRQEELRLREARYISTYVQRARIALLLRNGEAGA